MGTKDQKTSTRTIDQFVWSWGAVGVILGIGVGGGIAFMTSAHSFIADGFFLVSAILFMFKFFTWELPRQHIKRRLILYNYCHNNFRSWGYMRKPLLKF